MDGRRALPQRLLGAPDSRPGGHLPTAFLTNLRQPGSAAYETVMRIALFQPDIAGNVGTILRTSACFGVPVDIIEPCGFPFSDRKLKRAGMDYAAETDVTRHADWAEFRESRPERIVLLTVDGDVALPEARFAPRDILMLGSESSGAPSHVHRAAALRIRIPLQSGFRSLNVAIATGIALGEAMRQTGEWPQ